MAVCHVCSQSETPMYASIFGEHIVMESYYSEEMKKTQGLIWIKLDQFNSAFPNSFQKSMVLRKLISLIECVIPTFFPFRDQIQD
jgi:hypothetical protein